MKILLVIILILFVGACAFMPEKKIYTQIDIKAPPEEVWKVLADNSSYPQWNPYHVSVKGLLKEGEELDVSIHKPNGEKVNIHPKVIKVVPNEILVWGGGVAGIFKGVHTFELIKISEAETRLIHKETFKGLAIPFAALDAIDEGYRQMNQALKLRVENP